MARAYEKYIEVFGAKGFEHNDVEFVTGKGKRVILKWNKSEYRAFKKMPDGSLVEMTLGGVLPENLMEYIIRNY